MSLETQIKSHLSVKENKSTLSNSLSRGNAPEASPKVNLSVAQRCVSLSKHKLRSIASDAIRPLGFMAESLCGHCATGCQRLKKNAPDVAAAGQIDYASKSPLFGDSAANILEALVTHLGLGPGTAVFLPGILFYPHYPLGEMFDRLGLRVLGYEIDLVKLHKALPQGSVSLGNVKSENRFNNTVGGLSAGGFSPSERAFVSYPLVLLVGLGGRFLTNADHVARMVRSAFRAMIVELRPATVADLVCKVPSSAPLYADVLIMYTGSSNQLGWALAFTDDPLLERGLSRQLEAKPKGRLFRRWEAQVRRVAGILLKDGRNCEVVRQVVFLCSILLCRQRSCSGTATALQRFLKLYLAVRAKDAFYAAREIVALGKVTDGGLKYNGDSRPTCACFMKTVMNVSDSILPLTLLHRLLRLLACHTKKVECGVEQECPLLWDFLHELPNEIEVVSAGEPTTPLRCVTDCSDGIILRVESPELAARALCSMELEAAPVVAHLWRSVREGGVEGAFGFGEGRDFRSLAPHDAIILLDSPRCMELARRAMYLPMSHVRRTDARRRLLNALQVPSAAPLFKSPSSDFRQHVQNSPNRHAYRSAEVTALITSLKQHSARSEAAVNQKLSLLRFMRRRVAPQVPSKL
uniref:Uncharacterized protein n=1 Tax=Trypanosoma vivax (strain Y486) TaxID=1055687 RepID=G0U891_TRYVY|nr:conserved hypothetical protein, fragment [Trypanosoma vivax Y486]